MNTKIITLVAAVALATLGGVAYAAETGTTSGRRNSSKEEICLNLLAKADEKAQNKQSYLDRLDQVIAKLNEFEVPANDGVETGEVEAKRAEALAKATELKTKIAAVFSEYAAIRSTIDCSDPGDALAKVKAARTNVQGTSGVDVSAVNAQAKTVRTQIKSVFGSIMGR